MNRYERIMARKDKKRPELEKNDLYPSDALVLKIKLLLPSGTRLDVSWSEKEANRQTDSQSV